MMGLPKSFSSHVIATVDLMDKTDDSHSAAAAGGAAGRTTPRGMSDREMAELDIVMSAYRRAKQPTEDAVEHMLQALKSPFGTTPLRCEIERERASKCLASAVALRAESGDAAMAAAALPCREHVAALVGCSQKLEAEAIKLMREGHREMLAEQERRRQPPKLPAA